MSDLELELLRASGSIGLRHLERLQAMGVSTSTLAALTQGGAPIGASTAELAADGTYQPGPGPSVIIQPVLESGSLIDLVAWRTLRPARWYVRTGHAWALGADSLQCHDIDQPLPVAATPLEWLQRGGCGVCILDWASPEIRRFLHLETIETSDRAFGDHLIRKISAPARLPRVVHRMSRSHAA